LGICLDGRGNKRKKGEIKRIRKEIDG